MDSPARSESDWRFDDHENVSTRATPRKATYQR
jgi:hypothetical protein